MTSTPSTFIPTKPDFSSSNLVLMIGGQILFIVLTLLVLFFGTDEVISPINKNTRNSRTNSRTNSVNHL